MEKAPSTIFIVLNTTRIGGAEQRFFQLFCHFHKLGFTNIRLVLTESLLKELRPPADAPADWRDFCLVFPHTRYRQFLPSLFKLAWQFRGKKNVFHYFSPPPPLIHSIFRQKVIFSYTDSGFFEATLGKALPKILSLLALLLGAKLDVLNIENYERFLKWPFLKNRLFRTPMPFCLEELITTRELEKKRDEVVLCGRLESSDVKRVIYLLNLLPDLDLHLQKFVEAKIQLTLIGHGPRYSEAEALIDQLPPLKTIKVNLIQTHNPMPYFKRSKNALSLQRNSNYPSRSLIEALSQGCLPIVTDVGETRLLARPKFSQFVNDRFTAIELGDALARTLSLNEEERLTKAKRILSFVRKDLLIDNQASYYWGLYGFTSIRQTSLNKHDQLKP